MSLFARPCAFMPAVGTHTPDTDFSRASSLSRHFLTRARMRLWGGVRARIDTLSTTVHRCLDAVAREKSRVLTPAASRVRTLFADLETSVPGNAQRLLRFACGLHGSLRTTRAQGPVKTAMEKEQMPRNARDTRTIASRIRTPEKSSRCAL